MNKVVCFVVFVSICLFTGAVFAQQSSAEGGGDYYAASDDQVTILRDGTGQSAYHRDALLADAVEKLSDSVAGLAAKMEKGASQREVDQGIVTLSQEADAIPGLNKKQRAEVRRLVDRAIIKASSGDIAGLKGIKAEMKTMSERIDDHERRIVKLESQEPAVVAAGETGTVTDMLELSRNCTVARAKAEEAMRIAEEMKAEVEALKSEPAETSSISQDDLMKVAQAAGDAQGRADLAQEKAEEAIELAKANQSGADPAVIHEIQERLDTVDRLVAENKAALDELRSLTKRVDAVEKKADHAVKTAEEALRVAKDKADPGIVDIGVDSLFSGGVTGALLGTGTYWFKKYGFRVGLGGGVGYGKGDEDGHGWAFDTKLRFGYEVVQYFWCGAYVSMYGVGEDLSRQNVFGYSAGGWLRGVVPDIKKSGISLALTGYVGAANEFFWVPADPPAGLIEGATYNTERLDSHWTWITGVGISMLF